MAQICSLLEHRVIESFWLRSLPSSLRLILMHGYTDEQWREDSARVDRIDKHRGLARVRYHFLGPVPEEVVLCGGTQVQAAAAKVRSLIYHERTLMQERILWVSMHSTIRLSIDRRPLRLVIGQVTLPRYGLAAGLLRKAFPDDKVTQQVRRAGRICPTVTTP